MAQAAFIYSDEFVKYKFFDQHPLKQERLVMLDRTLAAYGVYDRGEADRITPEPIDPALLKRVHSDDYLDALRLMSGGESIPDASRFGLGFGDNPAFPGMWEASLLYAGASLDAARRVLDGKNHYAFNSSGGLHHAMRNCASGFCLINDNAVAAYAALDRGAERVAYVDIDVHHGDGTQAIFYDNPDVLNLSIHESGRTLFPGTGFTREIGAGAGEGYSINIPMAAWSTDEHYAYAFDEAIEPILRAYNADFYILQVGADPYWQDPLAHLQVTSYGWLAMVRRVLDIAGDKPLIALGGGGYNVSAVVRLWTLLQAMLSGITLPNEPPHSISVDYDISYLHDNVGPSIDKISMDYAWEAVRQSVASLKELVGERYGLR